MSGEDRCGRGTAHYDSFRNRRRPDLRTKDGVVYAKRAFGGPEAVLRHRGRYTHRIAIGNERLLGCENDEVRFRWRDYAHGNKTKVMRILAEAFIRRFLRHVLPKDFQRGAKQAASLLAWLVRWRRLKRSVHRP